MNALARSRIDFPDRKPCFTGQGASRRIWGRTNEPVVQCAGLGGPSSSEGGGASSSGSGKGSGRNPTGKGRSQRARAPGVYEVKVVSPPPRSLGVYALPPNTHNGDEIEVDGQGYVVTRVVLKYKLVSGKYVRDHNGLEVTPTSRFFLNLMLDGLVKGRYVGPTGPQD